MGVAQELRTHGRQAGGRGGSTLISDIAVDEQRRLAHAMAECSASDVLDWAGAGRREKQAEVCGWQSDQADGERTAEHLASTNPSPHQHSLPSIFSLSSHTLVLACRWLSSVYSGATTTSKTPTRC